MDFPQRTEPGKAFRRVMDSRPKGISHRTYGWWTRHDNRPVTHRKDLYEIHPLPWRVLDAHAVLDANDMIIFDEPGGYVGNWGRMATELIARLGDSEPEAVNESDEEVEPEAESLDDLVAVEEAPAGDVPF
jgi:hypothetical protein